MKLLASLLLVLALLGRASALNHTVPVCTESDYAQFYFETCLADSHCAHNLNLHAEEFEAFEYLLHTEILQPMYLQPADICAGDAFPVVLAVLRHYEFCKPNHILDIDAGCICRHDRDCEEKSPSHFRLSELSKTLLILVFVVLAIYIGLSMLKSLEKLSKSSAVQTPGKSSSSSLRNRPSTTKTVMLDVT